MECWMSCNNDYEGQSPSSSINNTYISDMPTGILYCFSNPSMSGILKVGMTCKTLEELLEEANDDNTWRPPTPYKLEFAKKVYSPCQKKKTIHTLLEQYTTRINSLQDFFVVSKEEVMTFFDLMDGEMCVETRVDVDGQWVPMDLYLAKVPI